MVCPVQVTASKIRYGKADLELSEKNFKNYVCAYVCMFDNCNLIPLFAQHTHTRTPAHKITARTLICYQ